MSVRQPASRWHVGPLNSIAAGELPAPPSGFVRALVLAAKLALEAAALIFLVLLFFVRVPQVNGRSMEPQLQSGEHVLINTLAYRFRAGDALRPLIDLQFRAIQRGDVVAFAHESGDAQQVYVKRVIGIPGDTIAIANGVVLVNRRALFEPYISMRDGSSMAALTVPRGAFFVLGDNRGDSDDSRLFGTVPQSAAIGRATLVVWPLNRAGRIR